MVYNTNELKEGVLNGSIPSAFADSAATSSVGTKKDLYRNAFVSTGQKSDKAFHMPNGAVEAATALNELYPELRLPAKDVYILPVIEHNLLISIPKFIKSNYIATFDKDEVNMYNANNTKITVTRAAIRQGWHCNQTKLWRIPLKNMYKTTIPRQCFELHANGLPS
jgi:hypothetical protein